MRAGSAAAALAWLVLLGGCVAAVPPPARAPLAVPEPAPPASAREAAANFLAAVDAVEPVAEAYCRAHRRDAPCDFRIVVDGRGNLPPNAFQTIDREGRPVIGFTLSLIAATRNRDEIAFVLGHEAAHHILGHIPAQQQTAATGAVLAGVLATLGGAGEAGVRAAQEFGAEVGARSYSKNFELEADRLGTEIAWRAGFDPVLGAAFFARLPDPGDRFLGTHPPNAARLEAVRRTAAALGR